VVRRHELTDHAWAEIAPLLPSNGRPGGQWAEHRRAVNGILWKLATGVPWRDLPERYGPWQTCYERFRRWQADGTWQRLLAHAQTRSDAVSEVDWRWWSMPRSCAPISTPPVPEKGTIKLRKLRCRGRPGTGTQPRWPHDQGPSGL
jgi:transposase